jgi:16S rRNA (adenine1518-N6/adenine1519-N6)-dimethyltransferase
LHRKTLKNALTGCDLVLSARQTGNALTAAGIDPKRRAETLSVEEFVALSNALCRELR